MLSQTMNNLVSLWNSTTSARLYSHTRRRECAWKYENRSCSIGRRVSDTCIQISFLRICHKVTRKGNAVTESISDMAKYFFSIYPYTLLLCYYSRSFDTFNCPHILESITLFSLLLAKALTITTSGPHCHIANSRLYISHTIDLSHTRL